MLQSDNQAILAKMLPITMILSLIALSQSCQLVTFDDPAITMYPLQDGIILGKDDPIWVDFGQEVDHVSAQRAVTVSSTEGTIDVVRSWQGNRLILRPVPEWKAGITVEFSFDGTSFDGKGNPFSASVCRSFSIMPNELCPTLLTSSLLEDTVISLDEALSLTFSKPIQRELAKRCISISPTQTIDYDFMMDDTVIIIKPANQWKGLTRYTWRVSRELKDLSGMEMDDDYMGTFRTMKDTIPISSARISAIMINEPTNRLPIGILTHGMGVLLEFDEPVNEESFRSCVKLEPQLPYTVRFLTRSSAIIESASGRWEDIDAYRLIVKAGLRDASGNSSLEDITFDIFPSTRSISVVSIRNDPPQPQAMFDHYDFSNTTTYPISLSPVNDAHSFTIEFSLPFSPQEAERLMDMISFRPIFPISLSAPTLNWAKPLTVNGTSIVLTYTAIDRPRTQLIEERHLYELRIKGGNQGFTLDDGTTLKGDFIMPLEIMR